MYAHPASVLVIERHPMMREVLCNAIIEEADLTIAEPAINSTDAPQLAIAIEPDTILLACRPDIILFTFGTSTDLEALNILRKSLPDIPILALIDSEVDGHTKAALEAKAQVILTKAASRAELISKLRELCTRESLNQSESSL